MKTVEKILETCINMRFCLKMDKVIMFVITTNSSQTIVISLVYHAFCARVGSVDFERRNTTSNRAQDDSPVLLPELHDSQGTPDRSSVLRYDDGNNDDDDVAAEDGDSKEEVRFTDVVSHSIITHCYKRNYVYSKS